MEHTALLPKSGARPDDDETRNRRLKAITIGAISVIALAAIAASGRRNDNSVASDLSVSETLDLDFDAGTRDHDYVPATGYPFIKAGRLVEPQRESTITLLNGRSDVEIVGCTWNIEARFDGGVYDEIKGVTKALEWRPFGNDTKTDLRVVFPSPGVYIFSSTCTFEDGTQATVQDDVKSFYVRRELRELSILERDAFLDAFVVLSMLETELGQAKYGPHYRSLFDFEHMHLHAASDRNVDHIHDGMGIATQHISITSEFELALQTVNPKLACPFWDYTIDSVRIYQLGENATISDVFHDSMFFTAEWFGKTTTELHTVTEGRFAYQIIPSSYEYSKRSPYGYLRAPWNINPSKYVTRFHKICDADPYKMSLAKFSSFTDLMWPTCDVHFKYSNSQETDTWYDWVWGIGYLPHGPVHSWIGGVGGDCDEWSNFSTRYDLEDIKIHYLQSTAFANLKNAWRDFLIEFPSYCSHGTDYKDCKWRCHEDLTANFPIDINITAKNSEYYDEIVKTIMCNTSFWPGDHLEAGSPIEASFWPIHPTIDRLLQYKQIVRPFKNKTWISGNGTCIYDTTNCLGHNPEDVTYWKVTKLENNTYKKLHLTNLEVRAAALSSSFRYELPYVYSNFNWSHCEDQGIFFKLT